MAPRLCIISFANTENSKTCSATESYRYWSVDDDVILKCFRL